MGCRRGSKSNPKEPAYVLKVRCNLPWGLIQATATVLILNFTYRKEPLATVGSLCSLHCSRIAHQRSWLPWSLTPLLYKTSCLLKTVISRELSIFPCNLIHPVHTCSELLGRPPPCADVLGSAGAAGAAEAKLPAHTTRETCLYSEISKHLTAYTLNTVEAFKTTFTFAMLNLGCTYCETCHY